MISFTAGCVYSSSAGDAKVISAAQTGVNVIIWSFIELVPAANGSPTLDLSRAPNLDCVAKTALTLQSQGLATTHMVSVGGWGGAHPLPTKCVTGSDR